MTSPVADTDLREPPAGAPPTSAHARLPAMYTVQQAATLSGLSEHTLRYYERIGLLTPVRRQASSGHRRYSATDLTTLESLACLRATGMPIDQMRHYLELRAEGVAGATELQELLAMHLAELQRREAALQLHMRYVALKIDYWRAVEVQDAPAAERLAREAQAVVLSMTERG